MARAMIVLLALAGAACGPVVAQKVITAADLADAPRTRITTRLSSSMREGTSTEESPSSITRDAVTDEAVIRRLTPGQVCFDLVVRTAIAMDAPLSSWRITVDAQPVQIAGEVVSVRDFPCTGEAPRMVVDRISQRAFEAKRIGEPKEIAFRVVERRATGCYARAAAASKRVRLNLTLPATDGKGDWSETFEWRLTGD